MSDNPDQSFLDRQGQSLLGKHSMACATYIVPHVCVVCGEETDEGGMDTDSITGNEFAWFCWECLNMTRKVRRNQQQ